MEQVTERDDAVSYEHDFREKHGPYRVRDVEPSMQSAGYFEVDFCPQCCCRLSWNRTLCFADEAENQCYECLTVWR